MVQPKKPRPEAPPSTTLRDRSEGLRARVADRPVDPVLAVIRSGRELFPAYQRVRHLPDAPDGERPHVVTEAVDALIDHLRGPLMGTPPETPVGAVELAKYVTELRTLISYDLADEIYAILDAIADIQLQ
ncbi:hypothetical protein MKK69_00490 [Methylobacterium sp. J-026]|uniref:hypothetical protein n=1 Tax=Methylobacterium sp. J-026 TaxID=2836624 RepID=UPI001FB99934|nr:hypothetical protein [Methylobacterium sp. J-026]MCJ2132561.1 hypothetical protein [Methylobacterium sp. J-026]